MVANLNLDFVFAYFVVFVLSGFARFCHYDRVMTQGSQRRKLRHYILTITYILNGFPVSYYFSFS